MYWQHPDRRQLIRAALFISPLMAAFRIAPVLTLNQDLVASVAPDPDTRAQSVLTIIASISIFVFLQWLFNIWLFTKEVDQPKLRLSSLQQLMRYVWSFAFAIGSLIFPGIVFYFLGLGEPQENGTSLVHVYRLIGSIANNAVILLIINLVITRQNESRLAMDNMKLALNNLQAQQATLKHQLQPHFLFNALYTLQLLIGKQPQTAKRYVKHLSTFLRSSIQYTERNKISLQKELDFCKDYLALQEVRFEKALQYQINIPEQLKENTALPVFSLQLLVENAIKHNALQIAQPLEIAITYQATSHTLNIRNNIIPKLKSAPVDSGVGLENLCERYQLLDPSAEVQVNISSDQQYFLVQLPLLEL
ncbi:MAG: histidine kinase [Bacteroidota bacterium]